MNLICSLGSIISIIVSTMSYVENIDCYISVFLMLIEKSRREILCISNYHSYKSQTVIFQKEFPIKFKNLHHKNYTYDVSWYGF